MLLPVGKGTTASKRFKSLIPACVPAKRNTGVKITHPDFHYISCQVNLVNQLAQICEKNTISLSVDNKMKVEVGNPATSRRNNIHKFYLLEDSPNYLDHDFPYRNSKLTPAGYQRRMIEKYFPKITTTSKVPTNTSSLVFCAWKKQNYG